MPSKRMRAWRDYDLVKAKSLYHGSTHRSLRFLHGNAADVATFSRRFTGRTSNLHYCQGRAIDSMKDAARPLLCDEAKQLCKIVTMDKWPVVLAISKFDTGLLRSPYSCSTSEGCQSFIELTGRLPPR
jgi:hypothetical protein